MIFPYREQRRGTQTRYLPLVPLTVHGAGDSADVLALIDSGAEHSVLPGDLADELRISLRRAEPVIIIGASEHEIPGRMIEIDLQIDRHRWKAPVVFAEGQLHRPLLGQIGFFAFFSVTFRYRNRTMEIRRNRPRRRRP